MRGKKIRTCTFGQSLCQECRHDRNKAVDHGRNPVPCRSQKDAAHRCQIQSSYLGEHLYRVGRIRTVKLDRLVNHPNFMEVSFFQQPASTSGDLTGASSR